jgi:hypothetical protein
LEADGVREETMERNNWTSQEEEEEEEEEVAIQKLKDQDI